jgi:hypothetical protein
LRRRQPRRRERIRRVRMAREMEMASTSGDSNAVSVSETIRKLGLLVCLQ